MSVVCIKCNGAEFKELPKLKKRVGVISHEPTYKGTVLKINAKCSDLYTHQITNEEGFNQEYQGYVPSFFPNSYSGNDYLELEIDPYTGVILNWENWKKKGESRSG